MAHLEESRVYIIVAMKLRIAPLDSDTEEVLLVALSLEYMLLQREHSVKWHLLLLSACLLTTRIVETSTM